MYLLSCLFERSVQLKLIDSIQEAARDDEALALMGEALDDRLERFTSAEDRAHLYRVLLDRLRGATLPPVHLTREDWMGAAATFWLVTASVIPTLVPFLVLDDRLMALHVANGLQIALLFAVGFRSAHATHRNPWLFGSVLALFGLAMVAVAIPLGG
jgi:VIT1/CCC1 family predicted Fe2+/Mn2+ transporter